MIILDFGSGSTCRNDWHTVQRMIDALAEVDAKRQCTVKWQLWSRGSEPQCSRLNWALFKRAYVYAETRGFRTTASVFDVEALRYLLTFDVPFVKIANRPYLRHLARYVPRGISIVASYGNHEDIWAATEDHVMICASRYPATIEDYEMILPTLPFQEPDRFARGLSDHTIGLDLWRKYKPAIYERHFRLPDSTGPDAGPWALLPEEVKELLA